MSEAGWRTFLAADDVDDWVVLHGGATAAFRVGSMAEAIRLAEAITGVPGVVDAGAVLTIAGSRLTVRLTRDMWFLEPHHVDLARSVSAVARSAGATSEPESVQEVQLAVAAKPDEVDLAFWRAVLGYVPMSDDNGVDPLAHSSTVWMQELDAAKPLRHAMHVDVSVGKGQGPDATGRRPRRRWPRRDPVAGALDARRPRRQPRLHRRLARRGHDRPHDRGPGLACYLPFGWCSSL